MTNILFNRLIFAFIIAIAMISESYSQDPNFHIYICFGQSNMEGQGAIEQIDMKVDDRFQVMQAIDCPDLDKMAGSWYNAIPPLSQCHSGLSPADYFGRTMVTNLPDSIQVGVINVAVGGCDIRLFDKDNYQNFDTTYTEKWFTDKVKAYNGNPYKHLMDLAKLAQKDGVIKGILLHQGETNTGDRNWPLYVKKIYNDFLEDLSLNTENVPLLSGEVVNVDGSCCSSMNVIINELPEFIENAHIISSKNCTAKDNAHFDSKGYRKLGKRYAYRMLSLLD